MKAFSELTSASQVNNSDLLAISQASGNDYASKKTTVKDVTDKANLNLAEEYDSTSTYAVDDYCVYESVLYKCTASTTGSFDSTKWTQVVITDEMGSGGGGTGGHTIINENGTSMTARAGLQFVGGANVSDDSTNNKTVVDISSAGGIDGVFIDTDNVIQARTTYSSSFSYTATEDCAVVVNYANNPNASAGVSVDGKEYNSIYSSSLVQNTSIVYLKKGQTLTGSNTFSGADVGYTVYGIQTGTTHSKFQPVIYSTEEREIGVWTDGRPLYAKTYILTSGSPDVEISHNSWTSINEVSLTDEFFVDATAISDDGTAQGSMLAWNNNGTLNLQTARNSTGYVEYVNVIYIRTSDVAGSGTWTPQGVPAVHYSTDEHIVGTYNGKTLYEKEVVINNVTINGGGSDIKYKGDLMLKTYITDADEIMPDIQRSYYETNNYKYSFVGFRNERTTGELVVLTLFSISNANLHIYCQYTKASS